MKRSETLDETDRLLAFGLGFVGIVLATIALFMPFVDEASSGSFVGVAENTILQTDYGWLNLILIGLFAVGLIRNVMSPHRVVWPLIVGGLTVASAVWSFVDEDARTLCPLGATTITDACSVAEPGLGIYMLGAGGASLAASWLFFRRFPPRATVAATATTSAPMNVTRECPHCKSEIRPDASVCPHCRRESPPWTLHTDGLWWRQEPDGSWLYYVPQGTYKGWQRFDEGAPTAAPAPTSES